MMSEKIPKTLNAMNAEIDRLKRELEKVRNTYPKYFVLKPAGDDPFAVASRKAMEAYAKEIEEVDTDLYFWMKSWLIHENHETQNRKLQASFESEESR